MRLSAIGYQHISYRRKDSWAGDESRQPIAYCR
jgi:hypothetical protein